MHFLQVKIDYPSGPKVVKISTPSRKKGIRQYTRRSYQSLASTIMRTPSTFDRLIREIAKKIKKEMKSLASLDHDSILRDDFEALKHFSWETVYLELEKNVPTLIKLLR